jgi:ATP-dependent Clp protease ATP-binding subunit ClpB
LSIVKLRVHDVTERLKDRRITLDIDEASLTWLADKGFSEVYGARAIARTVRTEVLFPLAQKLLTGTIRSDSSFIMTLCFGSHPITRDGDDTKIRVAPRGGGLDIRDNHPPDSNQTNRSESLESTIAEA